MYIVLIRDDEKIHKKWRSHLIKKSCITICVISYLYMTHTCILKMNEMYGICKKTHQTDNRHLTHKADWERMGDRGGRGDLKYLFPHWGEPRRMEGKPNGPGLELTEKELLNYLALLHCIPFLCFCHHSAKEVKSKEIICLVKLKSSAIYSSVWI